MTPDVRLLPAGVSAVAGAWIGLRGAPAQWVAVLVITLAVLLIVQRHGTRHVSAGVGILRQAVVAAVVATGVGATASIHTGAIHPDLGDAPHEFTGEVVALRSGEFGCTGTIGVQTVDRQDVRSFRIGARLPCESLPGHRARVRGVVVPAPLYRREAGAVRSLAQVDGAPRRTARIRADITRELHDLASPFPDHARGLIPGIAVGDTSGMPRELTDAMTTTQMVHLTAVSGGHISILVGMAILAVGRRHRVASAATCFLVMAGLVVLVGGEASVVRAIGMGIVVIGGMLAGRQTQAIPALSVTCIAVALTNPWMVTSIGFLLSCAATSGIVTMGRHLAKASARRLGALADACALSIAAQLACLPIVAAIQPRFSAWSVMANVLVAPVVAPVTVLGLIAAISAIPLPGLCTLCLTVAQAGTWWIATVAETAQRLPGSHAGPVTTLAVLLCSAAALLLPAARWIVGAAIASAVLLSWRTAPVIPEGWDAVVCDVGQGLAVVARVNGQTIMIDTGPAQGGVQQCLRNARVKHIDTLILTHLHADHIGGLADILTTVPVGEVLTPRELLPAENWEWARRVIEASGVRTSVARDGTSGSGWEILQNDAIGDVNAASFAVIVNVPGGLLIMSDQGEHAQQALAGRIPAVAAVVVPHHGSVDQSAALHDAAHARIAIVSVGPNSYGHPARSMRNLYSDATIITTLDCGTVALAAHTAYAHCAPSPDN